MTNARARHDERVGADPDIAADYDPLLLESLLRDQPMRVVINVVHRPYFHARPEQYVAPPLFPNRFDHLASRSVAACIPAKLR